MADVGSEEVFLTHIPIHFTFAPYLKTCYMKIVGMGLMRNSIQIKLYDIFRKDLHLPDEKAQELVQTIDEAVKGENEENLKGIATMEFIKDQLYATKEFVKDQLSGSRESLRDEIHHLEIKTIRAIFISNLIQFLAIVGSVIAIINFMQHK
jgi:hypothetical protein